MQKLPHNLSNKFRQICQTNFKEIYEILGIDGKDLDNHPKDKF